MSCPGDGWTGYGQDRTGQGEPNPTRDPTQETQWSHALGRHITGRVTCYGIYSTSYSGCMNAVPRSGNSISVFVPESHEYPPRRMLYDVVQCFRTESTSPELGTIACFLNFH